MAARVNQAELEELIKLGTDTVAAAFLTAANLFVDGHLGGRGLAETLLKEIERWVAADFVAVAKHPRTSSVSVGSRSATYDGRGGQQDRLLSTEFGKRAIALDPTGTLAAIAAGSGSTALAATAASDKGV